MSEIEIEIDGQKLTAKPNQMVIEVADAAGIYIPRFCYHKHLSIAANCRMCLVEVEKSPKALPACATPVMPGMKVFTKSPKTLEAQRAVMEFLLINHPLDCPVCDQGGECELQDVSMGYGSSHSHYDECKRAVADEDLGPLIETEMTRCILCTRCVRFGDEIAGIRELGVTNRGGHAEISTYVQQAMTSEVSGNIIDICPVGALTSKPYRFTARAWELEQSPSIAAHDCIGSNLNVHTRTGQVMRVVSRENAAVNETWLSDRDRFAYTGLYHADRLAEPMARINGKLEVVSWQQALEMASSGLNDVLSVSGASSVGALVSPNATLEECYLMQKLMRGMGSPHVDHRLRMVDTRDQANMPAFPGLMMSLTELEQCDAIVLIGSNLQKEQPLAALRLRKAVARQDAAVIAINPVDYAFNFAVVAKRIVAPQQLPTVLVDYLEAVEKNSDHPLALALRGKKKIAVLVGALAQHHPEAALLRQLAQKLASACGGQFGIMTDGANSAGAWLAGAIPHRLSGGRVAPVVGFSAYAMLQQPLKAYVLLNVEPDLDCANAAMATKAMSEAKLVVALSMYRNPVLEAHADVILPIAAFTETSGTYVNVTGKWQSFKGVATPFGSSRPAWKVLRVLGNFLHLEGFEFESSEAVREACRTQLVTCQPALQKEAYAMAASHKGLGRIGEIPIYAVDSLVRRAEPLQKTQALMDGEVAAVRLHPDEARALSLQAGDEVKVLQAGHGVVLPVALDARVPLGAAWIAGGIAATTDLGDLFGSVEINKV